MLFRGFSLVQGCQRQVVCHSFKLVISFYLVASGFLLMKCQWFAMGLLLSGYLLAQSTKFEVHMWHLQGLSKCRGRCIIFSSITKVSIFCFLKNIFLPMESKCRSNLVAIFRSFWSIWITVPWPETQDDFMNFQFCYFFSLRFYHT